jgi:predicted flap endonuclease-1-like 5' DNA nuclease
MSFHMRWPTQFNLVTQEFAARPEFYGKFGLPGHEGIDFQAPEGTKLYAVADGVVSDVRPDGDSDPVGKPYGNQVRIQHDEGYTSVYAHLVQIVAQKGQPIRAGQVIGLAGNTGNSFGAHLHLTIKKAGATQNGETGFPYDIVDPTPYLGVFGEEAPPAPPAQPTLQVQVNSPEAGYLNIRSTPSTSGALVVKVTDGAQLGGLEPENIARSKVGQQNQWLWVRAPEGQTGYAAAWYLRLSEAPVEPTAPLSVVVVSPDVPLKVRGGPGTGQPILAEAPHGTVLQALESEAAVRSKVGQQGEWLKVQTPTGVVGYSAAWYLGLQREVPPAAAVSFALPVSFDLAQTEEAPLEEERKLVHADDLTRIRGIGPKTAAALAATGLVVYEQLVSLKPDQLKAWLAAQGIRGRYTATWPKQARLIVEGHWKALATLQKKLTQK